MNRITIFFISLLCVTYSIYGQGEEGFIFADPEYANITIDGDMSDWDGIDPVYIDSVGDGGEYFDFQAAYMVNDENNLYIRVTFAEPSPYGDFPWFLNIGFNTDWEASTGFGWAPGFGAEFVVQGEVIFDQRDCEFVCTIEPASPDNNWGAFYYVDVAPLDMTTDFEVAIPRDLRYENDENGQPGLSNPDGSLLFDPFFEEFIVVFETEDLDYAAVEWMPNPGVITNETGIWYGFAEPPATIDSWALYE